jgi:hypothetical protein
MNDVLPIWSMMIAQNWFGRTGYIEFRVNRMTHHSLLDFPM